ncbi:MAG TPA: TIGR02996 domain-containing protein [Gemmataceae bacterium]|jgi:uncharacterized protein (TIGR02996 family)|nr:TIGR02996 domain-containing protein [Gemmataceae bacterium]
MPTEVDFLRAIIADPNADGPRLVYADWLEDCGDTARAEFIRIQCALAAMPENERQYHPLAERAQALEGTHREQWLQPLREALGHSGDGSRIWLGFLRLNPTKTLINANFRRGFAEYVHVETAAFLAHASKLVGATPLRTLVLEPADFDRSAEHWDALTRCPELGRLTGIHVRTLGVGPDEMRRFTEIPHVQGLRSFGLYQQTGPEAEAVEILARSTFLSRLVALELSGGQAPGDDGTDRLLLGPECKHLESLFLAGMPGISGSLIERLTNSAPFSRLTSLAISRASIGDVELEAFFAWLPPSVSRLAFHSCGLGNRTAISLAGTQHLRGLRQLELNANQITDIGALTFADSPNLLASTRLDLRGNPISRRVREALRIRCGHHVLV